MVASGLLAGLALTVALALSLAAVITSSATADAGRAGGGLLAVATVLAVGLVVVESGLRGAAAAVLVVAVFGAGARLIVVASPRDAFTLVAGAVAVPAANWTCRRRQRGPPRPAVAQCANSPLCGRDSRRDPTDSPAAHHSTRWRPGIVFKPQRSQQPGNHNCGVGRDLHNGAQVRLVAVLKGQRRGMPLSAAGPDQILDSARARAGLAQATCHQLRHTCLTRLREAGMALEAVQAQAGHASNESTRIYFASGR